MSAATGIKRLGFAVAALAVAGLIVFGALALLIPADTVREAVKTQIRTITGLDPQLGGDVAVSLFPTGSVRFNDVSLGDNRTGAPALTAEQLVVHLRFFPFLIGRIEIADVALVRPTINVVFAPDGGSNWSGHVEMLGRALQPNPDRVRSFSEIRIGDGTVILRDQANKTVETLSSVEFALAWPSISKSFAATGRFVWHEQPLDATLSLSDFVAALTGERSGLKLRVAGAPLKFAFDGYVSYRPTLKMEGTLAADTASLRETLRWAADWNSPGGGFGRFALKAQTNIVGGSVALSGVNVELDGNVGEGALTFASDGRKTVQGTLAAEGLDLTPYMSTARLLTGDRNWNRLPLTLNGLNGIDVDLRLSAARVSLGTAKLGRTAAAANLRGGNLTVAVGESLAFGGTIKGSLGLAYSPTGTDLKAQMQFSEVNLEQCLGELAGFRRLEGKGDIAFNLESSGTSVYELTEALNGTATLASSKGAIAGINVEQLLKRLERSPLAVRGDYRGGKTPYDTLSVNVKITQGMADVKELRLEGPSVRLVLAGSASIPSRELDLAGTASLLSAKAEAPAFELPFVVDGPFDDPAVRPDIQALISRSGPGQQLLNAVRGRLQQRDQAPTGAAPSAPVATTPAPQPTLATEPQDPQ